MSFELGVINAGVGLDTSEYDRKLGELPGKAEGSLRKVAQVAASYLAFSFLSRGAAAAVQAWATQEEAVRRVESAVRNAGASVERYSSQWRQFASQLQGITRHGDEETLASMAQGVNFGIPVAQMEQATRAAMVLAEKYRMDLATAMSMVGRAAQGHTEMLARYGVAIDTTLPKEQQFQQLLRLGATDFALVTDAARTTAGQLQQFRNAMGDTWEAVGRSLAEAVLPVANAIKGVAQAFNGLSAPMQGFAVRAGAMGIAMAAVSRLDFARKILSFGSASQRTAAQSAQAAQKEKAALSILDAAHERNAAVHAEAAAKIAVDEANLGVHRAEEHVAHMRRLLDEANAEAARTGNTAPALQAQAALAKAEGELAAARSRAAQTQAAYSAATANARAAQAAYQGVIGRMLPLLSALPASFGIAAAAAKLLSGGLRGIAASAKAACASLGPVGMALMAVSAAIAAGTLLWAKYKEGVENARKAMEAMKNAGRDSGDALAETEAKDDTIIQRLRQLKVQARLTENEQNEARDLIRQLGQESGVALENGRIEGDLDAADRRLQDTALVRTRLALEKEMQSLRENGLKSKFRQVATENLFKLGQDAWKSKEDAIRWAQLSAQGDALNRLGFKAGTDEYGNENPAAREALRKARAERARRRDPQAARQASEESRRAQDSLDKVRAAAAYDSADDAGKAAILQERILRQRQLLGSAVARQESELTAGQLRQKQELFELEQKLADLRKSSSKRMEEEKEAMAEQAAQRQARLEEERQERRLTALRQRGDEQGYRRELANLAADASAKVETARRIYDETVAASNADGIRTEQENKAVERTRRDLEAAQSRADALVRRKLDEEASRSASRSNAVSGGFKLADLAKSLGRDTQRNIEKNTKATADGIGEAAAGVAAIAAQIGELAAANTFQ